MRLTLPRPIFSLLLLAVIVFHKAILVELLVKESTPIIRFAQFLYSDFLVCLFVYFFLELPRAFFSQSRRSIHRALTILILTLVVFQVAQIRFFILFGAPLSYGMLQQLHGLTDFLAGIYAELDLNTFLVLITACGICALMLYTEKKARGQIRLSVVQASLLCITILVSIFALRPTGMPSSKLLLNQNFHIYFAASFFQKNIKPAEAAPEATISNQLQSLTKTKFPAIRTQMPLQERKKLNIIYYTLESTIPEYTSLKKRSKSLKPLTPNIARLAEQALVLNRHYTPEPASIKSLFAIYAGRLPPRTTDWRSFRDYARKQQTLAHILKRKGYQTRYLFTGNGETYYQEKIMEASFDEFIDMKDIKERDLDYQDFSFAYDDRALIQLTDEFFQERSDSPFFLAINSVFPHHPYLTPEDFPAYTEEESRWSKYVNSLHFADYVIGAVYDLLDKYSLAENTLFVLHSDHGEAFYQHRGNSLHSLYIYEENVKTVAMFVNKRLFPKRKNYLGVSSHIDLAPTTLDILGLRPGATMHGQSLIREHEARVAPVYSSFSHDLFGIIDLDFKYIYNHTTSASQLFNLNEDRAEKKNIFALHFPTASQYRSRIKNLRFLIQDDIEN